MTPDDLRQDIELKIVELIKQKLADGTMTEERSQAIAQHVLNSLKPGMSFKELHKTIFKLDDHFSELSLVILPFIRDYEKHITKQATENVKNLIAQGNYDAAETLAKKTISRDLDITWEASANAPSPPKSS